MDNLLIFHEAQKFSEENSIEQSDNLSAYDRWQLSRYGTILNNSNPEEEPEKDFAFPKETEIIFEQLNPE